MMLFFLSLIFVNIIVGHSNTIIYLFDRFTNTDYLLKGLRKIKKKERKEVFFSKKQAKMKGQSERETLKTFYSTLLLGIKQTSKFDTYKRPFKFAHEVITRKCVDDTLDFIIWIILFFVNDLFTVLIFYPFNIVPNLVPPQYSDSPDNEYQFYTTKIAIRYASVIFTGLTLIAFLTPWIVFFTMDINVKMPKGNATICYLVLEFFPHLMMAMQGYLFGAIGLSSMDSSSSTNSEAIVWMLNGFSFVLLTFNYIIWKTLTKYQITIKSGYFGTFTSPFSHYDLFIIFLVGLSHPFRSSPFYKYVAITAAAMIIYGVYRLYKSRIPFFATFVGETIYIKEAIDFIVYGIYTCITIAIGSDSYIFLIIGIVIYFFSFIFATGYSSIFHASSSDNNINTFDIQHTPTNMIALIKVRYAIINSSEAVADINFLNSIAQFRISVNLIPDITRICLVKGIDLDEIQMRMPPFTPISRFSLYFLAYQVNIFLQCKEKDDDIVLTELTEEVRKSTQKVDDAIKKFWTISDDDHRTLIDIMDLIKQTNNQISSSMIIYPQSQVLQQIRTEYFTNTLKTTSKVNKIPFSCMASLRNPAGTTLGFLNKDAQIEQTQEEDAPVERYFEDKISKSLSPIKCASNFYVLSILALILYFSISLIICYSHLIKDVMFDIDVLDVASCLVENLLETADQGIQQPSSQVIMSRLGLSYSDARAVRGSFTFSPEMPAVSEILMKFDTSIVDMSEYEEFGTCKASSFLLNIHDQSSYIKTDNSSRICYTHQLNEYIKRLYPLIEARETERKEYIDSQHLTHFIVLIVFAALFIISWIYAIINLNSEKKALIQGVRRATAFNEHRCEYLETKYFNTCVPIIYIILMLALLCIIILCYFAFANSQNSSFSNDVQQLTSIGKISIMYKQCMILAIYSLPIYSNDGKDQPHYIQAMKHWIEQMKMIVEDLVSLQYQSSNVKINGSEANFETLINNVRDYATTMNQDSFSVDDYSMLYSRYLALFYLANIRPQVFTDMVSQIHKEIQIKATDYWWIAGVCIIVLIFLQYLVNQFIERNKKWIKSATVIIRVAMYDDNEMGKSLLDILERRKPSYIDDFPFPVFVRRKDGAIVMCNTKVLLFTPHSKTQIIGQRIEHFFGPLGDTVEIQNRDGERFTMEVEIDNSGTNHEIVIFKDITKVCQARKTYNSLLQRLTPPHLELPSRGTYYIIRHRFSQAISNSDIQSIDEEESKRNITRISITATGYIGVAKEDADVQEILRFITFTAQKSDVNSVICVLTKGVASILPLVGKAIPTVCGKTADRAAERIVNGDYGCIFLDESLMFEGINEIVAPLQAKSIPNEIAQTFISNN